MALDRSGDVLAGWDTSRRLGGDPAFTVVEKYSGIDGALVWKWSPPEAKPNTRGVMVPVPDDAGNVWIGWNRNTVVAGDGGAVVTVLDGSTGREKWTADLARGTPQAFFSPGSLRMLAGGDAILMLWHLGNSSFKIMRVSGVDGGIVWELTITEVNRHEKIKWGTCWVDEGNSRILLTWIPNYVFYNDFEIRVEAVCLATGDPIWDVALNSEFGYDFRFARLTKRGDLELCSDSERVIEKIAWDHWGDWHGIPHPRRVEMQESGTQHVLLAGADGSEKSRKFLKDVDVAHQMRLESAGQVTREIHIADWKKSATVRWPLDARRWLADESMPGKPQCAYRVVRSPTGRLFLARQPLWHDLLEPPPRWELQMWE